jgi:hypothetical protein
MTKKEKIIAKEPFDLAPFEKAPFDQAQGLRQGLQKGLSSSQRHRQTQLSKFLQHNLS